MRKDEAGEGFKGEHAQRPGLDCVDGVAGRCGREVGV